MRDLTIDYTALSFVAPEKVLFRYKLEGQDPDWRDAGQSTARCYTNLSPGNYRFRVTACNNSGVWNEAGTFLDFSIAPAYYQTNWFRGLCAAAFLALLWALYQFRVAAIAPSGKEASRCNRNHSDVCLDRFARWLGGLRQSQLAGIHGPAPRATLGSGWQEAAFTPKT